MSRVAKNPVPVSSDVEVKLDGQEIQVKGKLGQLSLSVHPAVRVIFEDQEVRVSPVDAEDRQSNALAGTMRALINNMVVGVKEGFEKKLQLVGVGYRASAEGSKKLRLTVGKSHPVVIDMPEGVTVETPSQTEVSVKGFDRQKVAQVAADIREVRKPEPYKGKGIRYIDERIILKEGKKK